VKNEYLWRSVDKGVVIVPKSPSDFTKELTYADG
jgi:hypothetical protein